MRPYIYSSDAHLENATLCEQLQDEARRHGADVQPDTRLGAPHSASAPDLPAPVEFLYSYAGRHYQCLVHAGRAYHHQINGVPSQRPFSKGPPIEAPWSGEA